MKRVFVCLFVVCSLLLAPIAHAAGVNCKGGECTIQQSSKDKKQDDGKLAKVAHSCCHHQVAPVSIATSVSFSLKSISPIIKPDGALVSVTLDPLLEPPSHA